MAVSNEIIKRNKAEEIWKDMKSKDRHIGNWETLKEYLEEKKFTNNYKRNFK